ncbi:GMC family oxidoreductase N-terminal domain-containing protein [Actinomadura sp. 7K507]|uniref:GMC family oxidoreductase N-terminal domain-containing protein n=1 Tax=Actinomadura sp. 7K507 TaxID=2530365 RepID=UPI001052940A|nr:GMC family oxidoreductase N-terminal domain-containing protein [Actinomadura sp. 7K507]TDC82454.1 mycofactocin system GMC family oxidoreductase MftG [Actinomadura sp. 7K507]
MIRRAGVLVVGAGGSGAALAARLSEDPGRDVVVAEAGPVPRTLTEFPADLLDARLVPGARPGHRAVRTIPVQLTPGLPYLAARGRFLGGSTTVNGGYFVRARRADFDRWAASAGDDLWSYDRVLPLMRALETDLDHGATPLHGGRGPIPVRRTGLRHPAAAAFQAAARELGHPDDPDKNAQDTPGFGPVPSNTVPSNTVPSNTAPLNTGPSNAVDGRRVNTGIAYLLGAAADRPNLTVLGGCEVRSVTVARGRATGVVADHDGRRTVLEADEIILCAGALASPHLLHMSGIGPAADLARAGIRVVHDLPAVGATLSDHPQVAVEWTPRRPVPEPSGSWLGGVLHLPSSGGSEAGDLEILQSLVPILGLVGGTVAVPGEPLPFLVSALAPRTGGTLRTVSADPAYPPHVEYRYLETGADRRGMREAVRAAAAIVATAAFGEVSRGLTGPTAGTLDDDRELDRWIRSRLGTSQHTCGTVPMGPAGAVDGHGRVHGLEGLRVADTSILPSAPLRGPAATAVLVGEVIAHAIRQEPR